MELWQVLAGKAVDGSQLNYPFKRDYHLSRRVSRWPCAPTGLFGRVSSLFRAVPVGFARQTLRHKVDEGPHPPGKVARGRVDRVG